MHTKVHEVVPWGDLQVVDAGYNVELQLSLCGRRKDPRIDLDLHFI